jgi:hypothetical protein
MVLPLNDAAIEPPLVYFYCYWLFIAEKIFHVEKIEGLLEFPRF